MSTGHRSVVGPPLTNVERDRLDAKLPARWHGYGSVDTAELRRLYSSAFAFIFPSDYEGFGLPVLEAMACGCPVVAANLSSLPEVGATAALYAAQQRAEDYAGVLHELIDSETRAAHVRAGLARATEFSWSRTFEQTLSVYLGSPWDATASTSTA